MAASTDEAALVSLFAASNASRTLESAQRAHHEARLRYLRDARAAGWSWPRIADGLGLTATAVRRYWSTHRMEVGRLP